MKVNHHAKLLIYSFLTWLSFYLAGFPEYFQHWPFWLQVIGVPIVTLLYFPMTRYSLKTLWRDKQHFRNSLWLAFYLTLPLFVYDYLLLAVYKDLGIGFAYSYWYLTFFYFSFWLQIPWIGWQMEKNAKFANLELSVCSR